jgi:HSP20 family molecular chaperone IbpA
MTEINKNQNTESKNSYGKKSDKPCYFKKIKSFYRNFSPSKLFIATTFILIGIAATLITQNFFKSRQNYFVIRNHFPFEPDIAFADDNFFNEIEAMQKEIEKTFADHRKRAKEIFDSNNVTNKSKVSSTEDDKNYFYQLDFSGFKKEDVVVSVNNNSVSFSAENKKFKSNKTQEQQAQGSFYYSFLVPQYDEKKEPEIIRKDNQVIVKLTKKK